MPPSLTRRLRKKWTAMNLWEKLKAVFNPILIFYFLVIYIFASFLWWSYLHLQKNEQGLNNQIAIVNLLAEKNYGNGNNPETISTIASLKEDFKRKDQMIFGEGIVFLLLLLFGTYTIHKNFRKEIQLNRQQRNFLLSITHELKSPLAGLKLSTETLTKHDLSEEKEKRLLDNSLKDIDRLKNLVDNLLMAAKLEEEDFSLSFLSTDLNELLVKTFNPLRTKYQDLRKFEIDLEENLVVNADNFALGTAISNLLENAIKYSSEGDRIGLSAKRIGKEIEVVVWDEGIGISDADKGKVFQKFYRVGNEDTRSSKGTGLGLFIVKQLAELHQGKVRIENNQPRGSRFIMTLPYHQS